MSKTPSLTSLTSLADGSAVVTTLNNNNALIVNSFQNTLSIDGSTPNSMAADLDMNSNRITNLIAAVSNDEPVRKAEFDDNNTTLTTTVSTYASAAAASAAAAAISAATALAEAVNLTSTSTTSLTYGTGSKLLATQSGKAFAAGMWVLIDSDAVTSNYMHGYVTAYTGTSLTVNVTNYNGAGTESGGWTITVAGTRGASFNAFSTIIAVLDNGGNQLRTGIWGDTTVDFACTVSQVTLLADQAGSVVLDIWKDSYGNFPPTVADTITAAAKPTLSSASKYQDATLTGWTTTINQGDTLRFNVDSCTTVTRLTVALKVTKT